MTGDSRSRTSRLKGRLPCSVIVAAGVLGVPGVARAQDSSWVPPSWSQAVLAPLPSNVTAGAVPATIPQFEQSGDATGAVASYQPGGATNTSQNAFFAALGTNGRTCFSCHQPQDDWTISPATVARTFHETHGTDPLFAPVDGADCPDLAADEHPGAPTCRGDDDDDRDDLAHFVAVRQQLFNRGNFRIFLPIPTSPPPQWRVRILHDPYGCEKSKTYGLPAGFLSVYRRVLPSTNTFDLDPGGRLDGHGNPLFNIMWDAREPDMTSQFIDATKIHAQATDAQIGAATARAGEGVSFQDGIFTAQVVDHRAGHLTADGALGGPIFISTLPPGLNTVAPGPPPTRPGPTFTVFDAWAAAGTNAARASIARGEDIFNGKTKTFFIKGVPGFNDVVNAPQGVTGQCATCHNSGDRGNDFFLDPKRLGIMDNTSTALPPTPDMPLFAFDCPPGSITYFSNPVEIDGVTYDELVTTDPGVGLITGFCADLGKMKVPVLRGAAARAPFFHGGNVATLEDLVDFYDRRFSIGFTRQEKTDLVHFLQSL